MQKFMILSALALVTSPALAKDAPPPPPEPTDHIPWSEARQKGEAAMLTGFYDPGSAEIVYSSGFRWGFAKPIFGRRTWGWIACGSVNAKNRLGGYVGAKPFFIMVDANGMGSGSTDLFITPCDDPKTAVPLQPELQGHFGAGGPVAGAGGPPVDVAGQLAKFAELRDKGVITQAEFETQKARLLAM